MFALTTTAASTTVMILYDDQDCDEQQLPEMESKTNCLFRKVVEETVLVFVVDFTNPV